MRDTSSSCQLAGPPFTMHHVAGVVSRASGTRLEYRNLSLGGRRDMLIAIGGSGITQLA